MDKTKNLAWLRNIAFLLMLFVFPTALNAAGSGGVNAPEVHDRPTLILVSIDGFRWDYQDLYDTPTMDRIAAQGVRAEAMKPIFPTLTFPNHYSIATGLYPANHGLIGNIFPSQDRSRMYSLRNRESVQDGSWYGGEPIWVACERNGMVTAAYYFVGTEAPVDGVPLTHWKNFDANVAGTSRVDQVLDWLAMDDAIRPHLVTLYFEDVDHATHRYGPDSPQSIASIEKVDGYLDRLLTGIEKLPIAEETYLILVSDHGQASVNSENPFILETVTQLDDVQVIEHGTIGFLYLENPDVSRAIEIRDAINGAWDHGRAILRADAPVDWQISEEGGFADIFVLADPGHTFFSTEDKTRWASQGDHGWSPEFGEMWGIFLAMGPRLPKGLRVPPISVIDVYPLMMEIMGLELTAPVDGDRELLPALLQP